MSDEEQTTPPVSPERWVPFSDCSPPPNSLRKLSQIVVNESRRNKTKSKTNITNRDITNSPRNINPIVIPQIIPDVDNEALKTVYRCQKCGKPKKGHICTVVNHSEIQYSSIQSSLNGEYNNTDNTSNVYPYPTLLNFGKDTYPNNPLINNSNSTESLSQFGVRKDASFYTLPDTSQINKEFKMVDCYLGWFDLAITGIENLLGTFKTISWRKKERFLLHLEEERKYLERMREEYQIDSLILEKETNSNRRSSFNNNSDYDYNSDNNNSYYSNDNIDNYDPYKINNNNNNLGNKKK